MNLLSLGTVTTVDMSTYISDGFSTITGYVTDSIPYIMALVAIGAGITIVTKLLKKGSKQV